MYISSMQAPPRVLMGCEHEILTRLSENLHSQDTSSLASIIPLLLYHQTALLQLLSLLTSHGSFGLFLLRDCFEHPGEPSTLGMGVLL